MIISFLTGIVGAISSFVAPVTAAIGSTLGPIITKTATSLVAKLPAAIETAVKVLSTIANTVQAVAKIITGIPVDCKAEELGAKLSQPNCTPREPNESTVDYINRVHKIPFDEKRFLSMTDDEKMACKAIGTTLMTEGIKEKTGVELTPDFLVAMEKAKLTQEQICKYIEDSNKKHERSLDSIKDYFEGNISDAKFDEVKETLTKVEKEIDPTKSEKEINEKLVEMRSDYNKASEEWGKLE